MYSSYGFTLFECIIVICIITIISFYAVPSFQDYQAKQESYNCLKTFQDSFELAKINARLYGENIVICPSSNSISCNENTWNKGFIIFFDLNNSNNRQPNEQILDAVSFNFKYGNIKWYGPRPHGIHKNFITFRGDTGLSRGSAGRVEYCSNTFYHQKITLSLMANTRIQKITVCSN